MRLSRKILVLIISAMLIGGLVMPVDVSAQQEVPDALDHFSNRVVGYFPQYRMDKLDSIDFSGVTHVNLSFLTYTSGNFGFAFTDNDISRIKQKCDANGVKLLIALGGGGGFGVNEGTLGTPAARTSFINTIMSYVDRYDLDGVDIDTEIESTVYWNVFDEFISELSARLKAEDKLLTMAVASWFTGSIKTSTYNYFDFLNVMSYDESAGNGPVASMEYMYGQINHYMNKGITSDKLVVGVPFYGYIKNGGWGGGKTYAEIIGDNADNRYADYSESFGGVYYNGENTIRQKAEISKDYGGIMIWELGQDSFDENSLLAIIKDIMTEGGTISDMVPVSNLRTTAITPSTVTFAWNAAPEAVRYNIYQNSTLLGTTSSLSYTAMNLEPSTNYAFKVEAVSVSGVVSKKVSLGVLMPVGAASSFPVWNANDGYSKDTCVIYNGVVYRAKWYSQNEEPGARMYGDSWEAIGTPAFDTEPPIAISTDSILLNVGETSAIAASVSPKGTSYSWSSSNPSVAAVSGGVITAVSSGTATVTATTAGGQSASCLVTVGDGGTQPDVPELPEAYIFKVGEINAYWTTYDYPFTVDVPCQFVYGATYVPFRVIAQAAGAKSVSYDENAGTVTLVNGYDMTVVLSIDSTECTVTAGGQTSVSHINSAPIFIDGAVCLPVRDVANVTFASVSFAEKDGSGYVLVSAAPLSFDEVNTVIAAYNEKF